MLFVVKLSHRNVAKLVLQGASDDTFTCSLAIVVEQHEIDVATSKWIVTACFTQSNANVTGGNCDILLVTQHSFHSDAQLTECLNHDAVMPWLSELVACSFEPVASLVS
jgi:hypothetical protein